MSTTPSPAPPFQAGIIDIGAHSLQLDLYEVNRTWVPSLLESTYRPMDLGSDVFRSGSISPLRLEQLADLLARCRAKLEEYDVQAVRVVATSAVREAFNRDLVTDRLRGLGMTLEILEGSEEIVLTADAVRESLAKHADFPSLNALMLVLGTGSLFVVYFGSGVIRFCEEIPTGTMRLADVLAGQGALQTQLAELLRAQNLPRRLAECIEFSKEKTLQLILVGAIPRKLAGLWEQSAENDDVPKVFSAAGFRTALHEGRNLGAEPREERLSTETILEYFFREWDFEKVLVSGVTTRSALIRDLVRHLRTPETVPFREDLLAVCSSIARKYGADREHAKQTTVLAGKILAKLRTRFQFPPRAELLLTAASFLHDIGRFVDARQHHKHSCYLIRNTMLPGITDPERKVIAAVARYHRKALPRDSHPEYASLPPEDRVTVLKLAAILRAADALDSARNSTFAAESVIPTLREKTLFLQIPAEDLEAEEYCLAQKSDLFQQVYGMEIRLRGDQA